MNLEAFFVPNQTKHYRKLVQNNKKPTWLSKLINLILQYRLCYTGLPLSYGNINDSVQISITGECLPTPRDTLFSERPSLPSSLLICGDGSYYWCEVFLLSQSGFPPVSPARPERVIPIQSNDSQTAVAFTTQSGRALVLAAELTATIFSLSFCPLFPDMLLTAQLHTCSQNW